MPHDIRNRYFVPRAYDDRTISPTSRYPHIRTRNSTRVAPVPYPTPKTLMMRIDNPHGNEWYRDPSEDLYLRDLLFIVRMQTARWMEERTRQFPRRDRVLDHLIVKGLSTTWPPITPALQRRWPCTTPQQWSSDS